MDLILVLSDSEQEDSDKSADNGETPSQVKVQVKEDHSGNAGDIPLNDAPALQALELDQPLEEGNPAAEAEVEAHVDSPSSQDAFSEHWPESPPRHPSDESDRESSEGLFVDSDNDDIRNEHQDDYIDADMEMIDLIDIPAEIRSRWEEQRIHPEPSRRAWPKKEQDDSAVSGQLPAFSGEAPWVAVNGGGRNNTRPVYDEGRDPSSEGSSDFNPTASEEDDSDDEVAAPRRRSRKRNKGKGKEKDVTLEVAPYEPPPEVSDPRVAHTAYIMEVNMLESLRLQKQTLERMAAQNGSSSRQPHELQAIEDQIQDMQLSLATREAVDDFDDYPTDTNPSSSTVSNGGNADASPSYVSARFTPAGRPPRRKPARNPQEFWHRNRHKHDKLIHELSAPGHKRKSAEDDEEAREGDEGRRRKRRKTAANSGDDPQGLERLNLILDGHDPIAARAAMEQDEQPGATAGNSRESLRQQVLRVWEDDPGVHRDLRILGEAAKSFGLRRCMRVNSDWLWKLEGMASPLYNHQVVGVSWMLGRELAPRGPKGGILGDEMGLGKTVEMLACMTANPRTAEEKEAGTGGTLIIVPASVLSQWTSEIARHSKFKPPLHYKKALNQLIPLEVWQDWEIVIATYRDVARAFPSDRLIRKMIADDPSGESWRTEFHAHLGGLFKIKWHRVVLDEAHAIKTVSTQTSQACCRISARYRWAITGTPIHNSVLELFPYLDFLRDTYNQDFKEFKKQFEEPNADYKPLNKIVSEIMIRRRTAGWFMGRHLVEAPEPYPTNDTWITQSAEEEVFYRHLEDCFRRVINRRRSDGTYTISYIGLFAYITYLRQLTAHVFVGENHMRRHYTQGDIEFIKEELGAVEAGSILIDHVERLFEELNKPDEAAPEVADNDSDDEEDICQICSEIAKEQLTSPCGHAFCTECYESALATSRHRGDEQYKCPTCDAVVPQFEQDAASRRRRDRNPERRQRGDDYNGWRLSTMPSFFLREYLLKPEKVLPHSTKTEAVMNIVREWRASNPDDKIIIFTQWRLLGKMLGMMLEAEEIEFVYLFGNMGQGPRDKSIDTFRDNPNVPVMVSSLQTGGQGLNLTSANRVILVDLWWNRAMEQQAFSRVDRIGQTKRCHSVRVIMRDTIDGRLYKMQKRKEVTVRRALGEPRPGAGDLSVEEMVQLFGRVDEQGEVRRDYEDGGGGLTAEGIEGEQPPAAAEEEEEEAAEEAVEEPVDMEESGSADAAGAAGRGEESAPRDLTPRGSAEVKSEDQDDPMPDQQNQNEANNSDPGTGPEGPVLIVIDDDDD
ncbi:hypothetical protein NKR23_g3455 [Pleurostoma richardsiae]|uniref:Uncharacterized protein n=1 Tax=Pleurostoma richardsiae TaxID=41990 RepID=A0AA38RLA4_9PEZI|nr:hypothetical protein NKR23_g3455 [Pleurostoma richardsiae]